MYYLFTIILFSSFPQFQSHVSISSHHDYTCGHRTADYNVNYLTKICTQPSLRSYIMSATNILKYSKFLDAL
jgi:hypothetical protein